MMIEPALLCLSHGENWKGIKGIWEPYSNSLRKLRCSNQPETLQPLVRHHRFGGQQPAECAQAWQTQDSGEAVI